MHKTMRAALAVAAVLALSAGGAQAQMKWDMPNEYPASSNHAEGDVFFAKLLKEKSGGKIEIVHHFGASLGYKSKQMLDAIASGAVPIGDTYIGPLGGLYPIFLLSSLPFVASTIEQARVLYDVSKPAYEKVFAENNQLLLYASPWPPSGIWGKKPIDSLAVLKGLKIRTYDPNGTITMKNVGAAPVQLSWADVPPQLGAGAIEAVLTSAEGGAASKLWELQSHFTEVNYASPLNMVTINLDTWKKLTPELQKAVKDAAAETELHVWKEALTRVAKNYRDMRANKMTVVEKVPDDYIAALRKAGQQAIDEWVKKMGPDGEKILAEFRKKTGQAS